MNFYPRYIGDYQRDTSRLTMLEHGAYTLLLDDYYGTEQPLPAALDALYHLCRATTDAERSAVDRVCAMFFPIGDDGLRHHRRVDEEIVKAKKRIVAAKNNGKKRGGKKATGIPSGLPSGQAPHPHKGMTTTARGAGCISAAPSPVTGVLASTLPTLVGTAPTPEQAAELARVRNALKGVA